MMKSTIMMELIMKKWKQWIVNKYKIIWISYQKIQFYKWNIEILKYWNIDIMNMIEIVHTEISENSDKWFYWNEERIVSLQRQ